jgi:hypothetical protein
MAKRNYGIDYAIVGIFLLGGLAYDYNRYNMAMLIFAENCNSALELSLWGSECIEMRDAIDSLFLEMIGLGIAAAIFILIGIDKMRSPQPDYDDYENDSGWPWWIIIVAPIGLFVVALIVVILESIL